MQLFRLRMKAWWMRRRSVLLSVATHAALLLCLGGGLRLAPRIAPSRLPGTAMGVTMLTYYSPGSRQPVTTDTPHKNPEKKKATVAAPAKAPKPEMNHAAGSETGLGVAAMSGMGEGDITIALETYFPYPRPDLSTLPHGTKGDVILDAVVDEHGKISQLTLVKGLSAAVDAAVMATVREWTYTPAMREGVPVPSERELHFHYERG